MKTKTHISITPNIILFLVLYCALTPPISRGEDFPVGQVFGDGKGGHVFRQWVQQIEDRPVESVSMTLRRHSGGNDTFVNLRFGHNGQTFENGRRVLLTNNNPQTVTWTVGQSSRGEPLYLNAYNGEVYVESVSVRYQSRPTDYPGPPPPVVRPRPPHGDRDDQAQTRPNDQYNPPQDREALSRCRYAPIRRPRIELGQIRPTGGLFSGKYKVDASVAGSCIEEAGYYEYGRLKERIEIPLDDNFARREFTIKVRSGNNGSIRVYTTDGKQDEVDIDQEIQAQGAPF